MSVGHRYWCLSVLASYGIKCDVPEDEVLTDALKLLPMFDKISDDEHNRFTKRDVFDAMNMYQESYVTYSRAAVERVSGISVPPNKRNGRKQAVHMGLISAIRDFLYPDGTWRNKDGRPKGSGTKRITVFRWRQGHPDGKKIDCYRDTGFSRVTIDKWWNEAKPIVFTEADRKKFISLQQQLQKEASLMIPRELPDSDKEKKLYKRSCSNLLINALLSLLKKLLEMIGGSIRSCFGNGKGNKNIDRLYILVGLL